MADKFNPVAVLRSEPFPLKSGAARVARLPHRESKPGKRGGLRNAREAVLSRRPLRRVACGFPEPACGPAPEAYLIRSRMPSSSSTLLY